MAKAGLARLVGTQGADSPVTGVLAAPRTHAGILTVLMAFPQASLSGRTALHVLDIALLSLHAVDLSRPGQRDRAPFDPSPKYRKERGLTAPAMPPIIKH